MDDMDGRFVQPMGRRSRVVIQSPYGDILECAICLQFPTTNNKAEYEVVFLGLDLAKAAGAFSVIIRCDSQVVIRHINGDREAKREQMKGYLSMVKGWVSWRLLAKFVQIPREENEQVNCLA